MLYLQLNFCEISVHMSKFVLWVGGWAPDIKSKHFRDFIEVFSFVKIDSLKRLAARDATRTFTC